MSVDVFSIFWNNVSCTLLIDVFNLFFVVSIKLLNSLHLVLNLLTIFVEISSMLF